MIKNISIKQKLIFINFFSILIIFSFAAVIAKDAYSEFSNYNKTHSTITLSLELSALLHELQKERGVSTAFNSSNNNTFKSLILKTQTHTNRKLNVIHSDVTKNIKSLKELSSIRNDVSNKNISAEDIITYYSTLNNEIIETITGLSNTPHDSEIRDYFKNVVVLIKAKEKAGIERALLTSVFLKNKFTDKELAKSSSLTSEQKTLLNVFLQSTTPELKENFKYTMQHESFNEVNKIKKLAFSKNKDIHINSMYWFEMVSLKIDELKTFEDNIIHKIITLSKNKSFDAQSEFILVTTITLIVFLYTFLISYSIGNNILNSYNKIEDTLALIDSTVILSDTDKNGIITYVSQAFCDITGYTAKELIGNPHSFIRYENMKKEVFTHLWKTLLAKETWTGEIENQKKDGTIYWVNAIITPKYSQSNNLIGYNSIQQDITDKKVIEKLSITDALTSLFNRRHFDDTLPKIINTAKRENKLVCFMMLDIDFFKPYNDTYGHQEGDKALMQVAATIKNTIKRAGDYPFRLGGEEFGILFETKSKEHAINLAYTLKTNIRDLQIAHKENLNHKVLTVSIGLVCKYSRDIQSEDELYKEVDDLLYQAKESGRNSLKYS